MARGIGEAGSMIARVREVAGRFGLGINRDKSKVLLYNVENRVEHIEGIEVVREIKYLGVQVEDKASVFGEYRRGILEKGKRMSGLTFSVVEKSCHRVIIGKAYWKSVVLPSVLFGTEVIEFREEDIDKLQRQENVALR